MRNTKVDVLLCVHTRLLTLFYNTPSKIHYIKTLKK